MRGHGILGTDFIGAPAGVLVWDPCPLAYHSLGVLDAKEPRLSKMEASFEGVRML